MAEDFEAAITTSVVVMPVTEFATRFCGSHDDIRCRHGCHRVRDVRARPPGMPIRASAAVGTLPPNASGRVKRFRTLLRMPLELRPHPSFAGRPGPVLLVIADGVGVAPEGPSNAVTLADTPCLDQLMSGELYTELAAHGPAVGLPSDDDMGNSEVGHNAL